MPSSTRSSFVVMTKRCLSVRNHGAGRTDRAARLSPPARWQRSSSELHRGTRPGQREETSAPADTIRCQRDAGRRESDSGTESARGLGASQAACEAHAKSGNASAVPPNPVTHALDRIEQGDSPVPCCCLRRRKCTLVGSSSRAPDSGASLARWRTPATPRTGHAYSCSQRLGRIDPALLPAATAECPSAAPPTAPSCCRRPRSAP
jgi:hypothetical protein